MKNLFRFAILSLFLIVSSCVSNNDEEVTTGLEGLWRLISVTTENPFDFNNDGIANTDLLIETPCYPNETIEFNAGGTGVVTSRSYAEITANFVGNTDEIVYLVECFEDLVTDNITWEQNGSSVNITIGTLTIVATQNGDQLIFVVPSGFEFEGAENGGITTLLETVTFTYQKQ
jgi:hypothetical protein